MTEVPRIVKRSALPLRYPREFMALSRGELTDEGATSVICFTTPRCASTFTKRALSLLTKRYLGLVPLDLPGYMWHASDQPVYDELARRSSELFRPHGYGYVTLRGFVPIEGLERYKVLLMLRDPRDVMVSEYYSKAFSHVLPADAGRRRTFLASRAAAQRMTVDEYVLDEADKWEDVYATYVRELLEPGLATLVTYETMVADVHRWLDQVEAALGIRVSDKHRRELAEAAGGGHPAGSDDEGQHVRQRAPGDYLRKLAPSTVQELTRRLSGPLEALGYG